MRFLRFAPSLLASLPAGERNDYLHITRSMKQFMYFLSQIQFLSPWGRKVRIEGKHYSKITPVMLKGNCSRRSRELGNRKHLLRHYGLWRRGRAPLWGRFLRFTSCWLTSSGVSPRNDGRPLTPGLSPSGREERLSSNYPIYETNYLMFISNKVPFSPREKG